MAFKFVLFQVSYSDEEGSAHLSWQPVDINGDNPPQYNALMYEEKSQWNKEVYQGYETSCSVARELLSRGKTYSFGVRATSQRVTGKESDSEFIIVELVFCTVFMLI